MNNSASTDHRSWTKHGTIRLGNDSESVTLCEYDDVKIVKHLHVKQLLIIWFLCIHV